MEKKNLVIRQWLKREDCAAKEGVWMLVEKAKNFIEGYLGIYKPCVKTSDLSDNI